MKIIFKTIILYFFTLTCTAQVGALDTTFGVNGNAITYFGNMPPNYYIPQHSVMLSSGKIVGLFSSATKHIYLKRFNTNGSLDTTFGTNGGIDTYMPSVISSAVQIVLQTDGKLVVGGVTIIAATRSFLLRYNSDGTLDTTFGTNGLALLPVQLSVSNFAILPDNTFVLSFGGDNSGLFKIAKVTTNGSLDTSFGTNGIVATSIQNNPNEANGVNLLSVQPDGKIIATGTTNNGTIDGNCSVRYLPNGALDTSFGTNGIAVYNQFNSNISFYLCSQIIQSDGKFIVSLFYRNGLNQFSGTLLLRFNPNGSSDSTFGTNGSVLINNPTINSFFPAAGIMLMQPDNKIIVAGGYVDEQYHYFIGRLNTDGTYDTSFNNTGSNAVGIVAQNVEKGFTGIYLQADGKILAVGTGQISGGNSFALFSRFNSGLLETEGFKNSETGVFPNPSTGVVYLDNTNSSFKTVQVYNSIGQLISTQTLSVAASASIDLSSYSKGVYLLNFQGEKGGKSCKVVKE